MYVNQSNLISADSLKVGKILLKGGIVMFIKKLEKIYSKADKHSDDILKKAAETSTIENETSILKLLAKVILAIPSLLLFLFIVDVLYIYIAVMKILLRIARIIDLCRYKHISRKYGH